MLKLLILTYLEIGLCIGLQELGCAPNGPTAYSRRGPFFHIILQCIFWPLMYLVFRPDSWFEKLVKLAIIACLMVYTQQFALPWIASKMGQISQWAIVPTAIAGTLVVLFLFSILRMPGFKPKF